MYESSRNRNIVYRAKRERKRRTKRQEGKEMESMIKKMRQWKLGCPLRRIEKDIISETAKVDKECKNMVLHKEIVDRRVSSNKEHGAKKYKRISLPS